jgi:putative redox protein
MLSSLAVCSGIDVVSILEKMKVELKDFKINTVGSLTQEHPKYYNKVSMEYHFYGDQLDKEKINKAVNLSITKYCGVMEMFRSFAEITTEIYYNS